MHRDRPRPVYSAECERCLQRIVNAFRSVPARLFGVASDSPKSGTNIRHHVSGAGCRDTLILPLFLDNTCLKYSSASILEAAICGTSAAAMANRLSLSIKVKVYRLNRGSLDQLPWAGLTFLWRSRREHVYACTTAPVSGLVTQQIRGAPVQTWSMTGAFCY